jgi:flagellar biogenesis protein FliO
MESQRLLGGGPDGFSFLRTGLEWIRSLSQRRIWRRNPRRLRVSETVSLGNRGYLAVVRFEKQEFLVGGTNNSIALIANLSAPVRQAESFSIEGATAE